MATLERYLEALKALRLKCLEESLNPNQSQKTEFNYGFVCGIQQGFKLAEELLDQHLVTDEENDDGTVSGRTPARRAR